VRILITNDDGPSKGLLALVKEGLQRGHEVFVVTTEGQRSASSKSVAFRFKYREDELLGCPAYFIDSTPASAVAFALQNISKSIELVLSGINEGANLGFWDIMSSGTVGAVLEAALHGLRGMAVSLAARTRAEYRTFTEEQFLPAARTAYDIIEQLPASWPSPALNLNVPSFGHRGIQVTFPEAGGGPGRIYRCYSGFCEAEEWDLYRTYRCLTPGSDVCAVQQGFTSLTPLGLLSVGDLEWFSRQLAVGKR